MTGRTALAVAALATSVLATASAAWAQDYYEVARRDVVPLPPGEKLVSQSTTPLSVEDLLGGGRQATPVEGYLQLPEKVDDPVPAVIIFNYGDPLISDLVAGNLRLGDGQRLSASSSTPADVRARIGAYFRSCLTSGHYNGRHEVTRARALADVKGFLARAFAAAGL